MRKRLKSAVYHLRQRKLTVFSWRWREAFVGVALLALAMAFPTISHAVAITGVSFSDTHVLYEQGGIPNGTTVTFTIDAPGQVIMAVSPSQNVGVAGSAVTTLAQNFGGAGTYTLFWNGLWNIDGLAARRSGTYQFTLSLSTATGATPVSVTPATLVELASVDIHSIVITGTLDTNTGNNNFPYTISYALAKNSYVSVYLYNSTGTLIRTLVDNKPQSSEATSTHTVTWDGLTSTGASVPIGSFFVGITANDIAYTSSAIPRLVSFSTLFASNGNQDPKKLFEDSAFVFPNPIRDGQGTFQFQATRDGASIGLRIYTLTGTLVFDKDFGSLPTNVVQTFVWDATNQSGQKLGRGLYYYIFRESDPQGVFQITKKLAVIK